MKYISFILCSLLLLTSCGSDKTVDSKIVVDEDIKVTIDSDSTDTNQKPVAFEKYNLEDVTQGKKVRGITTSDTRGFSRAMLKNGTYSVAAVFENLPEPQNGDFYEGWIVQKKPFKFISTGKLKTQNDMQTNIFSSKEDYSSYTRYILTLEPDDGDPAPADHILEGTIEF